MGWAARSKASSPPSWKDWKECGCRGRLLFQAFLRLDPDGWGGVAVDPENLDGVFFKFAG